VAKYDTFKFQMSRDEVKCYGVMDHKQNCTALGQQGYQVKRVDIDNILYDVIYKLPLDFVLPLYISQTNKQTTIDEFFNHINMIMTTIQFD